MTDEIRLLYLNPRDLLPSAHNVRSDPGDLAGLAETIREHGILQPLGVRPDDGTYRVVYGHRRRDAAIVVGLDRVPCLVLDAMDDGAVVVRQVLENLQRLDLNDWDKSRAFEDLLRRLLDQGHRHADAMETMARTLGLSARQIQRYLRLRELSPYVQGLIAQGELGVTHAQHLVNLTPVHRQEEVADLAVEEALSSAELARLIRALEHNANVAPRLALDLLRRGESVAVIEGGAVGGFSDHGPRIADPLDELAGLHGDESEDDEESDLSRAPWEARDDAERDRFAALAPTTQDGNRVRKIHSLDAYMDELQRLTQCVQDGDLQRFLDGEGARVKLRLAARQLRFLAEAVGALADASSPRAGDGR